MDGCNFSNIDANINNLVNLKTLCFWRSLSSVNDFPELVNLKSLERLEITGGSLMRKRPPYSLLEKVLNSITKLNTLTSLDLSDWKSRKKGYHLVTTEKGRSIPDIFDNFPQLVNLDVHDLDIDFLPPSIFNLSALNCIYAMGNNLSLDCVENLQKVNINYY